MTETQGRRSARVHASVIAKWVRAGDASRTYRAFMQLSDDLAAVGAPTRVSLTAEPPESTKSRWDDAIAGLVELRLEEARVSPPTWVREAIGRPDEQWEPQRSSLPLTYKSDPSLVPDAFLRRGVLIEAGELESV